MSILVQKIINAGLFSHEDVHIQKNKIYTFLNPVSYITAFYYKSIYRDFDVIFADGFILVLFIRLLYGKRVVRRSFDMTSIAPLLFDFAQKNKKTIYIIASKQEEIEDAMITIKEKYPAIEIIGYRNGYLSSEEEEMSEIALISKLQPDILIVGMGVLKQDFFLVNAKKNGFLGCGFTCGGFIHQISKHGINYYPKWIDKHNLRFIYRIIKEKHTRKRYFKAAFTFPIIFIWDRFKT